MKRACIISRYALACSILALSLSPLPAQAAARGDLDADGVADLLPAGSRLADLDRDGRLELIRFAGRSLSISSSLAKDAGDSILLPAAIRDVQVRDLDGDGLPDLEIALASGRTTRVLGPGRSLAARARSADKALVHFVPTWNSGTDLTLTWDSALGNFDGDAHADIVVTRLNQLYVYENNGDDSFQLVYTTPLAGAPPGAFVTVAAGDTDGDGAAELIAGETSSLNQIRLYEATGDNTYTERPINISQPSGEPPRSMDKVLIADADGDGRREIIFDTSGSSSKVYVYEQIGAVGQNTYAKVFEYTVNSTLVDMTVGDSDNDGHREIILALAAGFSTNPYTLLRLENTADNTYVLKSTQPGGTGSVLSPLVADLDGDGQQELAGGTSGGGVYVFKSTGDDTYQLVFSDTGLASTGLASAAGKLYCSNWPGLAVTSFGGDIGMWRFNGTTYEPLIQPPLHLAGNLRSVDLGEADTTRGADLVVGSMGIVPVGDEGVFVFEQRSCP